jgi:hypothetical protein
VDSGKKLTRLLEEDHAFEETALAQKSKSTTSTNRSLSLSRITSTLHTKLVSRKVISLM